MLENKSYSKDVYKSSLKVAVANEISQDDFKIMFTCITLLIETILRSQHQMNPVDFSECLTELRFQSECIDDIKKLLSQQQALHFHFIERTPRAIENNFQYRINISLVDSGQGATIILSLTHNGKSQIINISLKHFHRFRLALSTALSEIHMIEGKNKN